MSPLIDRFTKESGYEFLSNFHPSTVRFEGRLYPTVEHAYQASKTKDVQLREIIRRAKSPMDAKKLGRSLILRDDWAEVRIPVMKELLREKFHNPFLGHLLLKTGDSQLVMNNLFNDTFWGVCRGTGENWLGRLLSEIRDELRKEFEEQDIQETQIE